MSVTLAIAVLGVPVGVYAAQIPPVPENPKRAQTFFGFNLRTRCPDLRIADAGIKAVVVFWVPQRGAQSQISIKTSSGSNELDSAAISCVSKLRFAPATTLGDGELVDSWQQIALGWAEQGTADQARGVSSQNPSSGAARAAQPAVTAPTPRAVDTRPDESSAGGNRATVHVCVDDKGKLAQEPTIVQSSGVATLDQAAVKIAAAGSAYYRPHTPSSKQSMSGCAQLAIEFNAK